MPACKLRFQDAVVSADIAFPNSTTLLQVLDANRASLGLGPRQSCTVKHRGKAVDMNLPWRLTGLVPNAVLDVLVEPAAARPVARSAAPLSISESSPPLPAAAAPAAAAPDPSPAVSLSQALQDLRSQVWDSEAKVVIPTLLRIVRNVVSNPDEERFRALRLGNPAFAAKLANSNAALQVLRAVGFLDEVRAGEAYLVLAPADVGPALREAYRALSEQAAALGLAQEELPLAKVENPVAPAPAVPAPAPFDVFRVNVLSAAPRPPQLGPSPVEMRLDGLRRRMDELLQATRGVERQALALRPSASFNPRRFARAVPAAVLAASAPGAAAAAGEAEASGDMQAVAEHQRQVAEKLRKQENFQTRAMREVDELSRARVFPFCVVRVLLPDRTVLQARFSPLDTVRDVALCVLDACGLDRVADLGRFHLLCGPPAARLDLDQALHLAGLQPAAVLQLVWAAGRPAGALRQDLFTVNEQDLLVDMPLGVPLVSSSSSSSSSAGPQQPAAAGVPAASTGKPKWLKI